MESMVEALIAWTWGCLECVDDGHTDKVGADEDLEKCSHEGHMVRVVGGMENCGDSLNALNSWTSFFSFAFSSVRAWKYLFRNSQSISVCFNLVLHIPKNYKQLLPLSHLIVYVSFQLFDTHFNALIKYSSVTYFWDFFFLNKNITSKL